ncbi:MAG: ABC transporter permease [Gammaproteobacteria bacterium]
MTNPLGNWRGMLTLFGKEVRRFLKVSMQTLLTPIVTALLYLLVFGHVLEDHVQTYAGLTYAAFIVPGLIMMTMIQNAFANSSSSLIQSKVGGSLVFVLLAPLSSLEFYLAFVAAAVGRGLLVGIGVYLAAYWFIGLPIYDFITVLMFAVLASATLGSLGIIAAIWADHFEQLAAFQNFIILPLSFLSGVFYSIHSLPEFWQGISRFNPFFYMIDGFRYGFFGESDVAPGISLLITASFLLMLSALCMLLLYKGYKLRR